MPFGLYNTLLTFQSFINDTLREILDDYTSAYLDDVLIFSNTYEEYVAYVRDIIERLQKARLPIDIRKSEFYVLETKYLGLIVGVDRIKIDLEKVQAILEQKTLKNITDI